MHLHWNCCTQSIGIIADFPNGNQACVSPKKVLCHCSPLKDQNVHKSAIMLLEIVFRIGKLFLNYDFIWTRIEIYYNI